MKDLISKQASQRLCQRMSFGVLVAEGDFEERRDEMRGAVLEVLGITDFVSITKPVLEPFASLEGKLREGAELRSKLRENRDQPIYPRIIAENVVDGYQTEKVFFFSAPDIVVTRVMVHPKGCFGVRKFNFRQTDLVLLENGTKDIPENKGLLEKLLEKNHRVFVFDVRGIGAVEMRQIDKGRGIHDAEHKSGCDAMMLGKSTLGLCVFDVLRGYDYLRTRKDVEKIGLLGVGSGAFFAYFAAALEDGFEDLTFTDLLYSYHRRRVC